MRIAGLLSFGFVLAAYTGISILGIDKETLTNQNFPETTLSNPTIFPKQEKVLEVIPKEKRVISETEFLQGMLIIPSIGVQASFEKKSKSEDGKMDDPSNSTDVAWYDFTSLPGEEDNIFLAGHMEVKGIPAVFWNLKRVQTGEIISLETPEETINYQVVSWMSYSMEQLKSALYMDIVLGPIWGETLTIMTCNGTFVGGQDEYDQRLVIKARRIG